MKLRVYDVLGREVAVLKDELFGSRLSLGGVLRHGLLASGLYFYRLEAGKFTALKKMLLVK